MTLWIWFIGLWLAADGPQLTFADTHHNFGSVREGRIVNVKFEFSNPGDTPLLLREVVVECGCTATSYSAEPIKPQAEGHISVRFFTKGRVGQQHKRVVVHSNSPDSPHTLTLSGEVLPR